MKRDDWKKGEEKGKVTSDSGMKKMKILQIVNYMHPDFGGIGQVARDIANVFRKLDNVEQKIICFNSDAADGEVTTHMKETVCDFVDGVEVIRCGCFANLFSQSISFTYIKEINKLMNEFQPDVVFFHYPNPFLAHSLLYHRNKNFKLVIYWHSDIIKQKFLGKLFVPQNHALLKRAWKVVATSPNYIAGSKWLSQYNDKCMVISCCVHEEQRKITEEVQRRINEIKNEGKILCFALGRHVPYKGMEYLVRASQLLDDRFVIVIGGQGPLTPQLKQLAEGDNKVQFLGRLSDDDVTAYYAACDIFCFPSVTKNEAFGIALAEGMYFGKPVVTFNIPGSGVNYVNLDGKTGIECPNGDVRAYADALLTLANNDELRNLYGRAAKQRVEELFMFETFKNKILNLVEMKK